MTEDNDLWLTTIAHALQYAGDLTFRVTCVAANAASFAIALRTATEAFGPPSREGAGANNYEVFWKNQRTELTLTIPLKDLEPLRAQPSYGEVVAQLHKEH